MPIAITVEDDFMLHEDAEHWETYQVGDDGPWMAYLKDENNERLPVDVNLSNVIQIQHMDEDDAQELMELF